MRKHPWAATLAAALLTVSFARAQDSTSLAGCLPGDAVDFWADGAAFFGSEQADAYVVDLSFLTTSWGTDFGVAPIAKSSKANFQFFNNLLGAQNVSRKILGLHAFAQPEYMSWNGPGFGVNNDPSINLPGTFIDATDLRGTQFAAVFREHGTTTAGSQSVGVVTTIVNVDPTNPGRLYVYKVKAMSNGCDSVSDLATFGVGAVDAEGHTAIRADGFGIVNGGCGGTIITGNNIYVVDALARDPNVQNVADDTGALLDLPATTWIVQNSGNTHTTPTLIPSTVTGGAPVYIGLDFGSNLVRGTDSTNVVADQSQLAPGAAATRGNLSYTTDNFPLLGSTHGLGAHLANSASGFTDTLNVFGLDGSGNVTGTMAVTLPAVIIDNATGFQNLQPGPTDPGPNEFDHYHSQVPFQGGNGNVALRVDPVGNLLLAAEVDHPFDSGPSHDGNYIAVCRIDPSGQAAWTMAGYNDPVTGTGKPILNAPSAFGGVPIGQMVPRTVTGALNGPSVSAPMIDAVGNVWFISSVELFGPQGSTFSTALLRAVYDPASFSYELELVLKTGDVFPGPNSGVNWMLTDLRIADSNSVDSATAWSGNVTDSAFMGYDKTNFAPSDPRSLGAIVIQGRALYDVDGDFQFVDDCQLNGGLDEEYRVLLVITPNRPSGYEYHGLTCPGSGGFSPVLAFDGYPAPGKQIVMRIENAFGGQPGLLMLGLSSQPPQPFGSVPCYLNITPLPSPLIPLPPLPGSGPGAGELTVPFTLPASIPAGLTIHVQAFLGDPGVPEGFTATRGVGITTQF